jgi:hypothetical protein
MTVATVLLGLLLAQGHGAKAGTKASGKKSTAARGGGGGEVQKRAPAPAASGGGSSGGSASGGGDKVGSGGAADDGAQTASTEGGNGSAGKNFKSKTYNFGAMDVEGKLKTPQLLYFLNRVKLELDMSAPDSRSFMKELEKSADDRNL